MHSLVPPLVGELRAAVSVMEDLVSADDQRSVGAVVSTLRAASRDGLEVFFLISCVYSLQNTKKIDESTQQEGLH